MSFPFPREVGNAIHDALPHVLTHLREGLPEEVVGLVMSDGSTVQLINQARSERKFTVSQTQLAEVLADIDPLKRTVYALYHTHPGGDLTLSPQDNKSLRFHWSDEGLTLPWLVMIPTGHSTLWWIDPMFGHPVSREFGAPASALELVS